MLVHMKNDVFEYLPGFVLANAVWNAKGRDVVRGLNRDANAGIPLDESWPYFPMVVPDCRQGEAVAICGAGPSLKQALPQLEHWRGDVWACNAAVPYLLGEGIRVTHACAIDQSPRMHEATWSPLPDVPRFLLATTCHPLLVSTVFDAGKRFALFHSFMGFPDERTVYGNLYPKTLYVGDGYNVVNRFAGLALLMGYGRVTIFGADCAFGPQYTLHADGTRVWRNQPGHIMKGDIDGRTWITHPDLALSAIDLVEQLRKYPRRIRIVGDTLPNALRMKDQDFLDTAIARVGRSTDVDESLIPQQFPVGADNGHRHQ